MPVENGILQYCILLSFHFIYSHFGLEDQEIKQILQVRAFTFPRYLLFATYLVDMWHIQRALLGLQMHNTQTDKQLLPSFLQVIIFYAHKLQKLIKRAEFL